jgi:2-polyprenyl-3-methyl-5-hydroxy-6-metoxy-1,4-benzoquinol methylase
MQKADRDRWDSIWIEHGDPEGTGWDYLSEVVFRVLEKEIGGLTGKSIAETGSGSGRISLRLARGGARPALFDYSGIAIDRSRGIFQAEGLKAFFIRSDIARIPVRNGSYDVVWNAGVMEHFDYDAQAAVLRDLIGICKAGGMVITLNPYSRSFLYASAKGIPDRLDKRDMRFARRMAHHEGIPDRLHSVVCRRV